MYTLVLVRLHRPLALLAVSIYQPPVPLSRQVRPSSRSVNLANILIQIRLPRLKGHGLDCRFVYTIRVQHIPNAPSVECTLPFQLSTRARNDLQWPSG